MNLQETNIGVAVRDRGRSRKASTRVVRQAAELAKEFTAKIVPVHRRTQSQSQSTLKHPNRAFKTVGAGLLPDQIIDLSVQRWPDFIVHGSHGE